MSNFCHISPEILCVFSGYGSGRPWSQEPCLSVFVSVRNLRCGESKPVRSGLSISSVSPASTFDSLFNEIGAVVEQELKTELRCMVWIGEDCRIRLWWDSNQKVVKFVLIIGNSSTDLDCYEGRSRGNSECASDDEFVHIHLSSSQKDSAMASLSTILQSEKAIDGDWVELFSPAMKVQALEVSNSPPAGSSEENPAITVARDSEVGRTTRYKNLKTTSTDPVPDIDPSKRETYLSEEEFGSLFGMSKSQFYALPKWRQA